MNNLLLIHGYGVDLSTWFRRPLNQNAGFEIFHQEITQKKAVVFHWTHLYSLSFLQSLFPWNYRAYYLTERKMATSKATFEKLRKIFHDTRPDCVICHSMGCYLLIRYVNAFGLPSCVKKVILVQGDCSEDELLSSGLIQGNAQLITTYRLIDLALWISTVFHSQVRIGLKKIKHPKVKSVYFPSFRASNLHTAILHDKALMRLVTE